MFDRRLVFNFNWILLLICIVISVMGVMSIYSAIHLDDTLSTLYVKQMHWMFYGFCTMMLFLLIDYHFIAEWAYLFYGVTIVLLCFVLVFGRVISGSQRWIVVGGLTIQVSEIAKVMITIALSKYFENSKITGGYKLQNLIVPAIITLIPFLLVAKQPDLGTSMVILLIFVFMSLIVGIKGKSLAWLSFFTAILLPFGWKLLKEYQKRRILTLFNPNLDPLGTGYHTLQSKIAIGSGGFWGKGLLAGTQSRLNFLPERHTDFIFSILAEETGFIGSIILIILYLLLIFIAIKIIYKTKDKLGVLIATGITAMFLISILVNIGMTLGLFPIVGIPLPFMSYGGSSTITTFAAIGLLLNIEMRRFKYE